MLSVMDDCEPKDERMYQSDDWLRFVFGKRRRRRARKVMLSLGLAIDCGTRNHAPCQKDPKVQSQACAL